MFHSRWDWFQQKQSIIGSSKAQSIKNDTSLREEDESNKTLGWSKPERDYIALILYEYNIHLRVTGDCIRMITSSSD
jgi:hypothetical protein